MRAIVTGPDDDGIAMALEHDGVTVVRIEGVVTANALGAADVESADLLVVTDVTEATAVPVAKERNPGLRAVVYAHDSVPEFARGVVDLAVDPALLDADTVADELTHE